jgi:hypothetical protein
LARGCLLRVQEALSLRRGGSKRRARPPTRSIGWRCCPVRAPAPAPQAAVGMRELRRAMCVGSALSWPRLTPLTGGIGRNVRPKSELLTHPRRLTDCPRPPYMRRDDLRCRGLRQPAAAVGPSPCLVLPPSVPFLATLGLLMAAMRDVPAAPFGAGGSLCIAVIMVQRGALRSNPAERTTAVKKSVLFCPGHL